jgi:hypothetical protein
MTSTPPTPGTSGSANSGVPGSASANGGFGASDPAPSYGSPSQAPHGTTQAAQFGAAPQPGQGQEPPKKSKTLWWVLGGCGCLALLAIAAVVIVVVVLVNGAGSDESAPTTASASSSSDEPTDSATPSDRTVDATPDDESSADADSDDSADTGTDVDPDDKDGALADAKIQSDMLYSSKQGIHDTLVFEGYSEETATYAADHVDADWNRNALEKAKLYEESGGMSNDDIHEQLTSEYGEQFTDEQADYAIKHLHD